VAVRADGELADASQQREGLHAGPDLTRRDLQSAYRETGQPWAGAQGFDFSAEDKLDSAKFNLVLWRGLMGDDTPYPASRNKRNLRLNRQQLLKQQ